MQAVAHRCLGQLLDRLESEHEWLVSHVVMLVDQRLVDGDELAVADHLVLLDFEHELIKLHLIPLYRVIQMVKLRLFDPDH